VDHNFGWVGLSCYDGRRREGGRRRRVRCKEKENPIIEE